MYINILNANKRITQLEDLVNTLNEQLKVNKPETLENEVSVLKEQLDTVVDNTEELVALKADSEKNKEALINANAIIKDLQTQIESVSTVSKQKEDELISARKAYQDKFDTQLSELKAQHAANDKSMNSRVAEQMAALGVSEEKISVEVKQVNPNDILAIFHSLNGIEKQDYYKKHESIIDGAARRNK